MMVRSYGSTGIDVSAIGFGGMRFGQIDDEDVCAELVKHAYDRGINYFDTAPGYFGGKSEERFGLAFRDMKKTRDEKPFYVSTKSNQGDPDAIRRDLEQSLERMGLDYIDFYHMWWVVRSEWYYDRKAKGALEAFSRLKEEGLIKHVCLSSHMSGEEIEDVLADYDFDGVLLGYSAINFLYRERALDAAANGGKGVVVMNPLGGGTIPEHADRLGFLRARPDETVVEAALRFLLNDSRIAIALVGFSETAHVDEAVRAAEGFKPIPAREIERMRRELGEQFDTLCTGCEYCMPCPQEMQVARLMQSYNQLLLSGKPQRLINTMKWTYAVLDDHGIERCTECGLCETRCTQKLPIRERLKEMLEHIRQAE
jgi:predicted aldo/keto reductase-like oxidoreductase